MHKALSEREYVGYYYAYRSCRVKCKRKKEYVKTMDDYITTIRKKIGTDLLLIPTVDCVIISAEDEILLQRRADIDVWGIIGGMMELNETVKEALSREVKEETGLDIQNPTLFGIYSGSSFQVTYPHGDQISPVKIVFIVNNYTGILRKDEESTDLKFYKPQELPDNIHQTHKGILDDVLRWKKDKFITPIVY